MEINVHDDSKLVDIWLTRAERNDEQFQERMKPLYQDFAEKHYTVAVFLSGDLNLEEETGELLCYNRKRLAELEVQREKEQEEMCGMTMTM